jgi:acetyl esterase/lipase
MPSLRARLARIMLRWQLRGWAEGDIQQQRARQAALSRLTPLPKSVRYRSVDVDGVAAEWIEAPEVADGVLLYLHGGAYCLGSVATHRELIARLIDGTRYRALALEYRRAPEHPFPGALEDTLTAYRWLLAQGHATEEIVFAGDSAGGGLAVAALVALRNADIPLPAAALCFSPWFDLTLSGASIQTQAAADPLLDAVSLRRYARAYAGDAPLDHPLISPLHAELHGLSPLLIQVGTAEILLDDAVRLADAARKVGVGVTLQTWEGLFHVFQMLPFLPETDEALAEVASFLAACRRRGRERTGSS